MNNTKEQRLFLFSDYTLVFLTSCIFFTLLHVSNKILIFLTELDIIIMQYDLQRNGPSNDVDVNTAMIPFR